VVTPGRIIPAATTPPWLKHTLAWYKDGVISLGYKPVTITRYQPKERVY